MSLPTPNTRKEQYLNAIATGNAGGLPTPITREEEYLDAIAKSGGGSGDGDMKKSVYDSNLAVANAGGIGAFVSDAISGKVDKVAGKGLSTNDYDNTEKGKVADNTSAIEAIESVTGAKNMLPLKLTDIKNEPENGGTWSGNSYTDGGVTFTFTVDSNDYVIDIATSGTSTNAFNLTFARHGGMFSKYSGMVLNGAPKVSNVSMFILLGTSPYTEYAIDTGEGATIATISDGSGVWFGINIGGTDIDMSGFHFYPMIRPAGTDPTYVPYSMTNRELTERIKVTKGTYTSASGLATISVTKLDGYYLAGVTCNHAGGYLCSFSNHSSTDYYVVIMDFDAANNTISFMKDFETELILTWIKE